MKKVIIILLLIFTTSVVFTSCREKSPAEKIEDGVEEVGEGLEDAVD